MNKVFKPLADLDFAKVLMEALADTQTGSALLENYKRYLLNNPASCTLVNNFLYESKNLMYDNGIGVKRDYKKAFELYQKAAEVGYAPSQVNLGLMYDRGNGVKVDYKMALKLYVLAAEKGEDMAINNLGWMYYEGHGVEKDYKEAIKYFKVAAEKGNVNAMNNLGNMYSKGEGVEKDLNQARYWYNKADQTQ